MKWCHIEYFFININKNNLLSISIFLFVICLKNCNKNSTGKRFARNMGQSTHIWACRVQGIFWIKNKKISSSITTCILPIAVGTKHYELWRYYSIIAVNQ